MTAMPEVVIAGGGIGGLTVSIALRNLGCTTRVYEKAPDFSQLGVALNLAPNGLNGLKSLGRGIYDGIVERGISMDRMAQLRLVDPKGEPIGVPQHDIDLVGNYGAPQITIRRNLLHEVFVGAHGEDGLFGGKELVGFADDGERVTVRFADGEETSCDLLIGAEGLNSAVRAQLHGAEEPHYIGWSNLRGISVGVVLPEEFRGGAQVRDGDEHVAIVPVGEGQYYISSGWQAPVNTWPRDPLEAWAGVKERVAGWYLAEELIAAIDPATLVAREVRDRLPIPSWSAGRVTLLGDAAHAMANFWGQGANSTMEDSVILARCLAERPDIPTALRTYDEARIARTARMQAASSDLGTHLRGYVEFVDYLYEYDAATQPLPVRGAAR